MLGNTVVCADVLRVVVVVVVGGLAEDLVFAGDDVNSDIDDVVGADD